MNFTLSGFNQGVQQGNNNIMGNGPPFVPVTPFSVSTVTEVSTVDIFVFVARGHESEQARRACVAMELEHEPPVGVLKPGDEPKWRYLRKRSGRRTIRITFHNVDHSGRVELSPDLFPKDESIYVTSVGCCLGHPSIKVRTVIPILRAFLEDSHGPQECSKGTDKLDRACDMYNTSAEGGISVVKDRVIRPSKPHTKDFLAQSDKLKELLPTPTVYTCVGDDTAKPKTTNLSRDALAELLEGKGCICLDMEIGTLWKQCKIMNDNYSRKITILPAFKGVSDNGAESLADFMMMKETNKEPATYNACMFMIMFLEKYFEG